jgi:hypothetical protein
MTMNFDHLTHVISNLNLPLSSLTTTLKRVIKCTVGEQKAASQRFILDININNLFVFLRKLIELFGCPDFIRDIEF